jgi:hypothetical protein
MTAYPITVLIPLNLRQYTSGVNQFLHSNANHMQNDTVHNMRTQCNLYDFVPKSVRQTDVTMK